VINVDLGHSGKYLVTVEADGRVSIHNLILGVIESSFYYYKKLRIQSKPKKVKINDISLSED
jgi:hypothetical protein